MKRQPIVILHGWSLSGGKFLLLAQELEKKGYRVWTPDLPGFGETKIPQYPLALGDYAHFLHEYLLDNKIVQPVFIGHSFGGRISLKYQYLYPKSVHALVLSGTPGLTLPSVKVRFFFILAKIGKQIFSLPFLSQLKNAAQSVLYFLGGSKDFYKTEGVMRETFKNIVREELVLYMQQVNIPCLLLWGEHDVLVPVKIAHRMKEKILGSKLVIVPGADHAVPYKEPKVFAETVDTFLKNI